VSIRITGMDVPHTAALPRVDVAPEIELGVDKGGLPAGRVSVRFDDVRMRELR